MMPLNQLSNRPLFKEEESSEKKEFPSKIEEIVRKTINLKSNLKKSKTKLNESKFTIVEKLSNLNSSQFESNLNQNFLNIESNLLKEESDEKKRIVNYGFAYSYDDSKEENKIVIK